MRNRVVLGLALVLVTGFAVALMGVDTAKAGSPEWFAGMKWVPTANWLGCDQNSVARECAEWQTPDGIMVRTCCIATESLGTSDPNACLNGGFTRGRTGL